MGRVKKKPARVPEALSLAVQPPPLDDGTTVEDIMPDLIRRLAENSIQGRIPSQSRGMLDLLEGESAPAEPAGEVSVAGTRESGQSDRRPVNVRKYSDDPIQQQLQELLDEQLNRQIQEHIDQEIQRQIQEQLQVYMDREMDQQMMQHMMNLSELLRE